MVIIFLILFFILFVLTVIQESTFIMIFSLISVFLLASAGLIYFSFEFLGYLLLIIYVGAVAVLFVFMVMLFDKSEYQIFQEARLAKENKFLIFVSSYFLSMILILILVLHLNFKFYYFLNYLDDLDFLYSNYIFNYLLPNSNTINLHIVSDVHAIGLVLYTDYFFPFILAGFGLLIAMVGAILITKNVYTRIIDKSKRKLQSSEQQLSRISSKFIKK